ncbi:4-diphosphocytidyl-2-C-methyl-D-erythritol kinase [Desulfobaculum xiamenense]|uniref:4-diphosphocytidyl-2-C-methyl-D-erythritol kinase n=1 Tax=Desulfobaculum xiamenense TaxID=995050 RepID=A0A846QE62_9BACT|nr:4-(cytidine 5'-diphospho)-2-C-methyl-D-erythritol kinase [Desulfobaculum xiamenense]NJB66581.1 4-diphosphocytidyl-2-C-methyl-D-erythritol kinase [Desulfobaculum xiamenense]
MNIDREHITLTAGCKVNLYLDITGVRENGYHDLLTLFVPLPEPADTLTVDLGPGTGIRIDCGNQALCGEDNTIARAYRAFAQATGFAPAAAVHLEKRIPTGAGLGGGSSDAACLLRLLNDRAGNMALDAQKLNALAAGIGADVPFFLQDSPAWATGIGERLTPTALDLKGFTLLLLCPRVHVSTVWAYRAWDAAHPGGRPGEKGAEYLTCGTSAGKCFPCSHFLLHNSFEGVVFGSFPELRIFKERLLRNGAAGAVLSGSGASLCGLFRQHTDAAHAADEFRRDNIPAFIHSF